MGAAWPAGPPPSDPPALVGHRKDTGTISTESLYALLLLVALVVFHVGAALAQYADMENASGGISVIGKSLMTIAIGAGVAVLILWVSPSISKGLDTFYCWNDHSITHCAMRDR